MLNKKTLLVLDCLPTVLQNHHSRVNYLGVYQMIAYCLTLSVSNTTYVVFTLQACDGQLRDISYLSRAYGNLYFGAYGTSEVGFVILRLRGREERYQGVSSRLRSKNFR